MFLRLLIDNSGFGRYLDKLVQNLIMKRVQKKQKWCLHLQLPLPEKQATMTVVFRILTNQIITTSLYRLACFPWRFYLYVEVGQISFDFVILLSVFHSIRVK